MRDRVLQKWFGGLLLTASLGGVTPLMAQAPSGGRTLMSPIQAALDENGDGEISLDELRVAEAKLKKLDANRDGVLSGAELKVTVASRSKSDEPEGLVATIMSFDTDKDGQVTIDEAPEKLRGLIERADANQDGAVTRTEIEKSLGSPIFGGPVGGQGLGLGDKKLGDPKALGLTGLGVPGNLVAMMAKRVFEQQDINKDGKISSEELTGAMKQNLRRIDVNSDGAIELGELQSIAKVFEIGSVAETAESTAGALQPKRP